MTLIFGMEQHTDTQTVPHPALNIQPEKAPEAVPCATDPTMQPDSEPLLLTVQRLQGDVITQVRTMSGMLESMDQRITKIEEVQKGIRATVMILKAQLMAMLADYYDRMKRLGGDTADAPNPALLSVDRIEGESDESFAHRRAMARRGIDVQATTPK